MSTSPSPFSPRHAEQSVALASSAASPIPHTQSVGLASASVCSPVASSSSRSSAFCSNLATFPRNTTSLHAAVHRAASNPRTFRPSALCSLGEAVARICARVSSSPKSRAFSAIMNCSAHTYATPSTVNAAGCHCDGQPAQKKTNPSRSVTSDMATTLQRR